MSSRKQWRNVPYSKWCLYANDMIYYVVVCYPLSKGYLHSWYFNYKLLIRLISFIVVILTRLYIGYSKLYLYYSIEYVGLLYTYANNYPWIVHILTRWKRAINMAICIRSFIHDLSATNSNNDAETCLQSVFR